ncbi:MFS transporter [Streptomyces spectabilis]|uniref:EmrB/QacA subfamily drug resistance transporter n=1 Tax=Streptomyces spectabilis TaxID=68270 RepID=A0A5P2XGS0_STRST|nr:MFS transporter [Streptomyces spectabilis]MBB5108755.1 EmrB/QacA subfamily drug resistance transporter [Streptomyces spectabilis]MCI3904556.1 MFS transporter [Streptomyces spectabilis]QEV61642.1 MFS transporter [Streptomyces spectabilis]GGV27953.1 MFS transporter [Streptomyces spectabilis]
MTHSATTGAARGSLLLPVLLTVQFLVSLDVSVVNIALPDVGRDLGFAPESLTWVVNAYALAFGGLLMLGGRLADLMGRRRTLVAGFVVFGAASLAGGLAQSPAQLVAARAVQGAGAAALAPVALALITVHYTEGRARARALGLWGASGALGGAVGVMAGGLLTDWAGWRSVMLINVPVVLAALAVTGSGVPADRRAASSGPRPDVVGALLVTAGTSALVLGLVRTESHGWGSVSTLSTLAAAVVLLVVFCAVEIRGERRARQPLLRLGLLAHRPVLAANVFALLMSAGQFAAFYFTSLYLQEVMAYEPTRAGVAFLPFCVGVVVGTVVATRTVGRVGARVLLVTGGLLGAAGFAWFALAVGAGGTFVGSVLGPSLVASVGIGLCFVPLGTSATSGVAPGETGMASGLLNSSRQLGGSIGLAVLVAVAASATGPGRAGLADGYGAAFAVAAALLAAAAVAAGLLHGGAGRAEDAHARPRQRSSPSGV